MKETPKIIILFMVLCLCFSCAVTEPYADVGAHINGRDSEVPANVLDSLTLLKFQQTDTDVIIANHLYVQDGKLLLNLTEADVLQLGLDMNTYVKYTNVLSEHEK